MRVLHLISSGGMYGAEAMLLNLASAQQDFDCEPVVGVFHNLHAEHLEVADRAAQLGLTVEVIPCNGRIDLGAVGTIRERAKKHQIDLIHTHGYKSTLYGTHAARKLQIPNVVTCHLWTKATSAIKFYEFLDAWIMRRAARVIGVSDAIAQSLRSAGIPADRVRTVYNGTDLQRFSGAAPSLRQQLGCDDRPLIGTVGRLENQKGMEFFIRAAAQAGEEFPDARFVIVGEGSQRQKLQSLIQELQVAERVLLLGERQDMPGVYASLDLMVLASIDEGMPMTILEALAAARPTIATNVGAVEKLILHGNTGLMVEPRDVPALRESMLQLLRQPAYAHKLGQAGEALVRHSFSAESMARQYVEIYQDVLETHRPRGTVASASVSAAPMR